MRMDVRLLLNDARTVERILMKSGIEIDYSLE